MKNSILALITLLLAIGCKKEKQEVTTFSYVKTVVDSLSLDRTHLDYRKNFYFYQDGFLQKDSLHSLTSSVVNVFGFIRNSNNLTKLFGANTTKIFWFDANGITTEIEDRNPSYLYICNYDEQKRLIIGSGAYVSGYTYYDTLSWSSNNLTKYKRKFNYNPGRYDVTETTYQYDLSRKNNLLNKYNGLPFLHFNSFSTSENICTNYTEIEKQYSATSPTPSTFIREYSLSYTFDNKNRISTITITRNSIFYRKLMYTYYE